MAEYPADRKLSIKDVVVSNDRLIKEVSALMKMEKKQVTDIVKFMGEFIAKTIQGGKMETVMLPGFGKFKPRASEINRFRKSMLQKTSGMAPMYKALAGKFDESTQEVPQDITPQSTAADETI